MARPSFEPTAEQRRLVQQLAGIGCTADEIVECVPWSTGKSISVDTLQRKFPDELRKGRALAHMRVRRRLFDEIENGNTAALIFYCKSQLGMKETAAVELSGKDGAALTPAAVVILPAKDAAPEEQSAALEAGRAAMPRRAALIDLPAKDPLPTEAESPPEIASPERLDWRAQLAESERRTRPQDRDAPRPDAPVGSLGGGLFGSPGSTRSVLDAADPRLTPYRR
jgi:hypothetical protein